MIFILCQKMRKMENEKDNFSVHYHHTERWFQEIAFCCMLGHSSTLFQPKEKLVAIKFKAHKQMPCDQKIDFFFFIFIKKKNTSSVLMLPYVRKHDLRIRTQFALTHIPAYSLSYDFQPCTHIHSTHFIFILATTFFTLSYLIN